MPTSVERRLRQMHKTEDAKNILLPILEDNLEHEVIPENEGDFRFLDDLIRRRAMKREKGVFSPSMLAGCMRQAYFAKTGMERHPAASPQTNSYFLQGNFFHLKWQFALHKAEERGLLKLVQDDLPFPAAHGCEVRVHSTQGDFAGTIDALVEIDGEVFDVDFKGINLVDFQRTVRDGAKIEYRIQIVGYAMIVNGSSQFPFVVKNCLLVSESKPGPMSGFPLALHEQLVKVDEYKSEVRRRLKELRAYEEKQQVPEPACVSTRHIAYQECPFFINCTEEVRAVQQRIEATARSSTKKPTVARTYRASDRGT